MTAHATHEISQPTARHTHPSGAANPGLSPSADTADPAEATFEATDLTAQQRQILMAEAEIIALLAELAGWTDIIASRPHVHYVETRVVAALCKARAKSGLVPPAPSATEHLSDLPVSSQVSILSTSHSFRKFVGHMALAEDTTVKADFAGRWINRECRTNSFLDFDHHPEAQARFEELCKRFAQFSQRQAQKQKDQTRDG